MQRDKLLGALGLCRRAGRLAMGAEQVLETAARGRAQLVLLAADASERTVRRIGESCEGLCPVRRIHLAQAELSALGRRPVAVLAVTDQNLARLCQSCLAPPQEDGPAKEALPQAEGGMD